MGGEEKKNRQNKMVTVALSKREAEKTGYGLSYHWLSEDSLTEGVKKKKKKENPPVVSPKGRERWKNTETDNVRFTGR